MTDDGLAEKLYAVWAGETGLHPVWREQVQQDLQVLFEKYATIARAHFAEEIAKVIAEHKACIEEIGADQLSIANRENELHAQKDAQLAAQAAEIARLVTALKWCMAKMDRGDGVLEYTGDEADVAFEATLAGLLARAEGRR